MDVQKVVLDAFRGIRKRAEQQNAQHLRNTFADSGVLADIRTADSQIIYGRRGTGKTHALSYLRSLVEEVEDIATYTDLRSVGSANTQYTNGHTESMWAATLLFRDVLREISDQIEQVAYSREWTRVESVRLAIASLRDAAEEVKFSGTSKWGNESSSSQEYADEASLGGSMTLGGVGANAGLKTGHREQIGHLGSESHEGEFKPRLNFPSVSRALTNLSNSLNDVRIWILLDEWSSLDPEMQPYFADCIKRSFSPASNVTVKIAAIEQNSTFQRLVGERKIGFELGADFTANVNLDEFMVYESSPEKSVEFFKKLIYNHVSAGISKSTEADSLSMPDDLVRWGFTDIRAFNELVRAAEGVPRDAINIVQISASLAAGEKISVRFVRSAAKKWFQDDKEKSIEHDRELDRFLSWIIDQVIRGKKARAFLATREDSRHRLIQQLFASRILHLVKKGYSAQDNPGDRYNVWCIDYGAYVDLISTKSYPENFLDDSEAGIEVPHQDLRAVRRAVLSMEEFNKE